MGVLEIVAIISGLVRLAEAAHIAPGSGPMKKADVKNALGVILDTGAMMSKGGQKKTFEDLKAASTFVDPGTGKDLIDGIAGVFFPAEKDTSAIENLQPSG